MSRLGCIYIAEINVPNFDYFESYIGYTIHFNKRINEHFAAAKRGSTNNFHSTIRKYGEENVIFRILEDNIPEKRLPDREELWIAFYDTFHNGLNSTIGGESSPSLSPVVAAKISKAHKELSAKNQHWTQQPENATKLANAVAIGAAINKELAKRGEAPQQRPEVRAKNSAVNKERAKRGEHQTQQPEVKAKISKAHKERVAKGIHSSQRPEVKAKISATQKEKIAKGIFQSQQPEVKAKISATVSAYLKEISAKGEHPMQCPEIAKRMWVTRRRDEIERGKEAGQLDLFDYDKY